jgi:hypothetical protein
LARFAIVPVDPTYQLIILLDDQGMALQREHNTKMATFEWVVLMAAEAVVVCSR